jgi:hypothetical protein
MVDYVILRDGADLDIRSIFKVYGFKLRISKRLRRSKKGIVTMAKKKRTAPRKTQKKGGKTRKKLRPGLKKGKRGPMGVLGKGPMGVLGKGPMGVLGKGP